MDRKRLEFQLRLPVVGGLHRLSVWSFGWKRKQLHFSSSGTELKKLDGRADSWLSDGWHTVSVWDGLDGLARSALDVFHAPGTQTGMGNGSQRLRNPVVVGGGGWTVWGAGLVLR